jgi:hypothetical protein
MSTAFELRTVLGNRVRYTIELDGPAQYTQVAAAWTCGCRASGTSFTKLKLEPCTTHRERSEP